MNENADYLRAAFDWMMKNMPNVEVEGLPRVLESLSKTFQKWFDAGRTSHEEKKKVYDEIEGLRCDVCGKNPKLAKVYCADHIPPEPPLVDPATGKLTGIDFASGSDRTVWVVMGINTIEGRIDCDYIDKIFANEEAAKTHLDRRLKESKDNRRRSYYLDDHEVETKAPLGPQKCKNCWARSDAFGVYETCTFNGPSHEWEPI